MNKKILIPAAAAVLLAVGGTATAFADNGDCRRQGAEYGFHRDGDHDRDAKRAKRGHGMFRAARAERNLDADAVRDILEGQLAWRGMTNLKVGAVSPKDDKTFAADIVTKDDSLAWRVEVDRRTGRPSLVQ